MKLLATTFLATVSGAAASAILREPAVSAKHTVNVYEENVVYSQSDHDLYEDQDRAFGKPALSARIPTSYESAVLARRMLNLLPFGTASTVFPHGTSGTEQSHDARPAGLGGVPVALPEYLAVCEGDGGDKPKDRAAAGNPTLLAIAIATTFKNARAGSNVSLALQWTVPQSRSSQALAPAPQHTSLWNGIQKLLGTQQDDSPPALDDRYNTESAAPSEAALPRFSLIGYLEPIKGQDAANSPVARCFVETHPDARYWLPGNRIHNSAWMRLVVTQVYWVGGFGDRAYIGWIPLKEWHNVTRKQWESVRLPGEHSKRSVGH